MNTKRWTIFALFVLVALAVAPLGGALAYADEVSGAVKASDYAGKTLTVKGKTTLTVDKDTALAAIDSSDYALTIKGGKKLTVKNNKGAGIKAKQLTVQGATVVSTGSDGPGIQASDDVSIQNANVTAKGDAGISSSSGSVEIKDSSVKATGEASTGIVASTGVSITKSKVNANGDEYGIRVSGKGDVVVDGASSVVEASGDDGAIACSNGAIKLDEALGVTQPEGASVAKGGKTIVAMADGSSAISKVTIMEADEEDIESPELSEEFKVTFDANGHGKAPNVQVVTKGKTVTEPKDLTEAGWKFGGWFTDEGCTTAYDFGEAVEQDFTLYAKWTEVFTVTFDANGNGTAPEAQKVEKGATAEKPADPKADGYDFGGWFKEQACQNAYDFGSSVTGNITLYAKWEPMAHKHETQKVAAKAATCTEAGNMEHWKCKTCNKLFKDEAATKETTEAAVAIEALGHEPAEVPAKAATCTEAGNAQYWKCTRCNKLFSDKNATNEVSESGVVIPSLGGHKLTHTAAKDATCTAAGNIEYWTCSRCGKYFTDSAGATEIAKSGISKAALGHNLTHTAAKAATCTAAGNTEYWKCSRCGKYFSDSSGSKQIKQSATVVAATGHKWGTWTVTKQATTTETGMERRVCANDSSHVETRSIPKKSATITYTVSRGANASWTKGSNIPLPFTVTRSENDTTTYSHFRSISVDNQTLVTTNYTVRSGSLIANINAAYLQNLTTGSHSIVFNFDDGTARTTFTVNNASSNQNQSNTSNSGSATPTTGDMMPVAIVGGIALVALIAAIVAFFARKRTK